MNEENVEVWFEIEWSHAGANDWYSTGIKVDTELLARKKLKDNTKEKYDLRVVRKSILTEVLS